MREGDPRSSKRSKPATPRPAPAKPAHKPVARKPSASSRLVPQKLSVTKMPAVLRAAVPATDAPSAPLISRTATLDDPFTTSLLAEIARRSRTVDVSPEQIAEAMDADPDSHDPDDSP